MRTFSVKYQDVSADSNVILWQQIINQYRWLKDFCKKKKKE